MANRRGKSGNSDRFYFGGLQITVDSDCSQEIKRCLLLGRKAMTTLDSILKSTDITLQTKICIVRAVVFPVVMYECESWIIKKAECQKINAFQIMVLKKTLVSPLDCKEIKPVNPKGNQPEYSLEGLMLKLQYFGHLMWRANSLEKTLMLGKTEGRRRRGQQMMKLLDSITNLMDMSFSKLQEIVEHRGAWHATACGVAKSWTKLSNWTTTNVRSSLPAWSVITWLNSLVWDQKDWASPSIFLVEFTRCSSMEVRSSRRLCGHELPLRLYLLAHSGLCSLPCAFLEVSDLLKWCLKK